MTHRLPFSHRTLMCFWTLTIALSVTIGGCDPSDRCDPDQVLVHGLCGPAPIDASGIDAGTDDDDAGAVGDAATDPYAGFGRMCTDQAECTEPNLVCGTPSLTYCTRLNCLAAGAGTCPPGWTCLDIAAISPDPTVMSICLQP